MHLLANNRSIIIKEADRGSCVIARDREGYIAAGSKQLNDEGVHKTVKFKDNLYLYHNNFKLLTMYY